MKLFRFEKSGAVGLGMMDQHGKNIDISASGMDLTEHFFEDNSLENALKLHQPQMVIALGQADGRSDVSIERVAINVCDARIPDNEGAQPVDVAVVQGGPAAYFSTLPIKKMVTTLKSNGYPASVSQTAGTFVCNQVFYGLQHALKDQKVASGFIHVPLLPSQAAKRAGTTLSSMSSTTLRDALLCLVPMLASHAKLGEADFQVAMGANS